MTPTDAAAPAPSGWRDVATDPPPDRQDVLVAVGDTIFAAYRDPAYGYVYAIARDGCRIVCTPTHWMPLPAAPQEAAHDRD